MAGSLRARVTIAFTAIAAVFALLLALAISSLTSLGGAIATILRENYRSVIACQDMNEALERIDSAAQFASTGHEEIAAPLFAGNRLAFGAAFEVEAHNITLPGEGALVQQIDRGFREYDRAVEQVVSAQANRSRSELYFGDLLPRFTELKRLIQHVARMNQANMEDADRRAKAMARRSVATMLSVGTAALLLALLLAWRTPSSLVRPILALADSAQSIGAGHLDIEVVDSGVGELKPLTEAFRRMIAQLRAYRESSLGELLEARDLANTTIQCLQDPVVVFAPDGGILLTNETAEHTFGLQSGSATELAAAGVVVPEAFASARDRVFETRGPVSPRNFREAMPWQDPAGQRFFLVRAAPLRSEAGETPRAIVIAQDVTRFRRIDDLKSDMVATVSHEFKTPLTSLRMATHLLLETATGPLTDAQREVVTTARDDTERLRALVDELLDLVRIEAEAGVLHRRDVDPRRLLEAVVEAHRTIARDKSISLEIESGPMNTTARIDPDKIGIVLANLVSNAIRHTPAGGRVALAASMEGGTLKLRVRDSGTGMRPEDLARWLDRGDGARHAMPFGGRHGLGLTIAQEIVLQHGGELSMQSAEGRGAEFTVALPQEKPDEPTA